MDAAGWMRIGAFAAAALLLVALDAWAQPLAWARQAGGTSYDAATGVAADAWGNVYVTGTFSQCPGCFGTGAVFDAGGPHETFLPGVDGTQDIFLAKYDSHGSLVWVRGAGGVGADEAYGVAVDAAGNSYVTGRLLGGPVDFGGGVLLTDPGVFVVKYDGNGTAVWGTSMNPGGIGFAIDVSASGSAHVTGYAPDPTFGGSIITTWKLGPSGSLQWVRQGLGVYSGGGTGISVDGDGNSVLTGQLFSGEATFGAGELNETILKDVDGVAGEIVIVKYDSSGSLVWARQSADLPGKLAYGTAISTDASGNAHVVGIGETILGLGQAAETAVTDFFIARYDALGDLVWAKSIQDNGSAAAANGIAVDAGGNSYIAGNFATTVTFDPAGPNETTLISFGGFFGGDLFVAKYDETGAFLGATQAGGFGQTNSQGETGAAISLDSSGNAYVAGIFGGDTVFGYQEPFETVLSSSSVVDPDIYVAKYGGPSASAPTATKLTAMPNVAAAGTAITLNADVSSVGGVPTGSVDFYDGATLIGTADLANGIAQLIVSTLSVGVHDVSATYAGSASFDSSSSPAIVVTITPSADGPDLTAAWQSLGVSCGVRGCTVAGTLVIANQGNADVPPGGGRAPAFVTRFYFSTSGVLDGTEVLLGEKGTKSLNAGQAVNVNVSFRPGGSPAGQYVIAVVDAVDAVVETDESNNTEPGVIGTLPGLIVF